MLLKLFLVVVDLDFLFEYLIMILNLLSFILPLLFYFIPSCFLAWLEVIVYESFCIISLNIILKLLDFFQEML